MQMKIELLGTSFTLQSDENSEYLQRVIDCFKEKLEEIQQTVETPDPLKLAILTGMLIADELFKAGHSPALSVQDLEEAEKITLSLIETISQTLEENEKEQPPPNDIDAQ